MVDLPHPLAVALGQIVVYRHDVDAFARKGVQIGGKGRHKGFAFAGLHFRDTPLMKHDAADQLHRKMPHMQHAVAGLPDGGKGLRQDIIQGFPFRESPLKIRRLCLQLFIRQLAVFIFERLDLFHEGHDFFYFPIRAGSKEFRYDAHLLFRLACDSIAQCA